MSKLTAKQRSAIPNSKFAGPDRSYPVNDPSHARNALARSAGKPVAGRVRAAVAKKFPGIGQAKRQAPPGRPWPQSKEE